MSILTNTREIFQSVKRVSTVEAARRYMPDLKLQRQGNRWRALCPFHHEKTPSFYIFPDGGWKCFGCQASGDVISLVARALNVRPGEAARIITQDFCLSSACLSAQKTKERPKEEDELRFQQWCKQVYEDTCLIYRNLNRSLKTLEDYKRLSGLVHITPVLEHVLNTLAFGSRQELVNLYKSRSKLGWCREE